MRPGRRPWATGRPWLGAAVGGSADGPGSAGTGVAATGGRSTRGRGRPAREDHHDQDGGADEGAEPPAERRSGSHPIPSFQSAAMGRGQWVPEQGATVTDTVGLTSPRSPSSEGVEKTARNSAEP